MTNREKVIKGLEYCEEYFNCCDKCPYWDGGAHCTADLAHDALALLKEQEAVEPTKNEDGELFCGNCGDHIGTEPHSPELPVLIMNYCPSCGRRVKKQNMPIHKDWWVK